MSHPGSYDLLVARFGGRRPDIQCWSPTEYRVSYPGWHMHDGACSGAPSADGKTLEVACASLLCQIARRHVELVEGACDDACHASYSGSEKSKLAHGVLRAFIKNAAAQVARWPAWKRGLPSCAREGCNMAAGHPGSCCDTYQYG